MLRFGTQFFSGGLYSRMFSSLGPSTVLIKGLRQKDILKDHFSSFGTIQKLDFSEKSSIGQVQYQEKSEAQAAIDKMNGKQIEGNYIKVWMQKARISSQDVRSKYGSSNKEEASTSWGTRDRRSPYLKSMDIVKAEHYFKESHVSEVNFNAYENVDVEINIPIEDATSMDEVELHETIRKNVKRMNYSQTTPIQQYAIPALMDRHDLMACAQTGSGKTAAFLIPTIQKMINEGPPTRENHMRKGRIYPAPVALIMAPTRELVHQIQAEARKTTMKTGMLIARAIGGIPYIETLQKIQYGVDLLVATPGRLIQLMNSKHIDLSHVKYFIIDEADRMLDIGFVPQLQEIEDSLPQERETAMFSATFPEQIQLLASQFLEEYAWLSIGRVGMAADSIEQIITHVEEEDKLWRLMEDIEDIKGKILVFVATKHSAEKISDQLANKGYEAGYVHGDLPMSSRVMQIKDFKSGKSRVLIATDLASRGLDIPDVEAVINFDCPMEIDSYVHRIGRTGRAGNKGKAITYYNDEKGRQINRQLKEVLAEADQEIPSFLNQWRRRK